MIYPVLLLLTGCKRMLLWGGGECSEHVSYPVTANSIGFRAFGQFSVFVIRLGAGYLKILYIQISWQRPSGNFCLRPHPTHLMFAVTSPRPQTITLL